MFKHLAKVAIVGIIMIILLRVAAGDSSIGRWYCTLIGAIALIVGVATAAKQYNHGLTCNKCNEVALPISDTGNRYRCPGCGRQFAGVRHGI